MKKIAILLVAISLLLSNIILNDYKDEIEEVKKELKKSDYNKNYALLIDYTLHSSLERMFLVDLSNGKIIKSFKVLHGRGYSKYFSLKKDFSNKIGSNKSSIGFSVLKEKSVSIWGKGYNYRIKGLSKTNSNICKRNIVLHSWGGVIDIGLFPIPLPQSQGCPTISNTSLEYIDSIIRKEKNKNIIIYSFNEKK